LIAGENELSDSATRGVTWLFERQNSDRRWEIPSSPALVSQPLLSSLPRTFYFPLMALGRFRRRMDEQAAH
jgi:hypothetical protein